MHRPFAPASAHWASVLQPPTGPPLLPPKLQPPGGAGCKHSLSLGRWFCGGAPLEDPLEGPPEEPLLDDPLDDVLPAPELEPELLVDAPLDELPLAPPLELPPSTPPSLPLLTWVAPPHADSATPATILKTT
jgi:hypothetical protein